LLRVATYNVHGCVGIDGRRSEKRIADVIATLDVDVIGLQELDLNRRRSGRADQAGLIAEALGWSHAFHPAMRVDEEQYGNATLSRLPMRLRQAKELPSVMTRRCPETRAAIWVEVETTSGPVQLINTHLGLGRRERAMQAALLIGTEWLLKMKDAEPVILLGDFNSLPRSAALRLLEGALRDVKSLLDPPPNLKTFPTRFPLLALDHIFVNERVQVNAASVVRNRETRIASDHFPLVAELRLA
jgi:endonuclease/exonuclease/phosphatase family metal-dependent hydrolase